MADAPSERARGLVRGGFDLHVHVAPDVEERALLQLAHPLLQFSDALVQRLNVLQQLADGLFFGEGVFLFLVEVILLLLYLCFLCEMVIAIYLTILIFITV